MRISIRRPAVAALASVGLAGGAMLLAAGPAAALVARSEFGTPFGSFSNATGLTIDQSTGNLFVTDGGSSEEIKIFGPEGEAPVGGLPSSIKGEDSTSKSFDFKGEPAGPAFDSANHVLYFPDVQHNLVDKYKVNGAKLEFVCEVTGYGASGNECGETGGSGDTTKFDEPLGTAVDAAGDLYVENYSPGAIYEFNAKGEDVQEFKTPSATQFAAVAPSGTIYWIAYRNGETHAIKRSSLTGASEGESTLAPYGSTGVFYDSATGNVVIDTNYGAEVEEINAKGEDVGSTAPGVVNKGEGVVVNETTNRLYVIDTEAKDIAMFGEGALLPDATTLEASAVGRTTATLKGSINPDGTKTKYWFEWGSTSESGYAHKTAEVEAGEGAEPVEVSVPISGLEKATSYRYRVVAENENGANPGKPVTFTTASAVEGVKTNSATGVTATEATLNGQAEPNGEDTHCWFEYTGKEWYGYFYETFSGSVTAKQDEGSGSEVKTLAVPVSELEPSRTYYYRVSCENSIGTSNGAVRTFRTQPSPPIIYSETTEDVSRQFGVLVAELTPANSYTTYFFEYGLTNEYGYRTPVQATTLTEGRVFAKAPANELVTNTLYHFRVVAENAAGTTYGEDQTFMSGHLTPPVVSTGGASAINPNGAIISGVVNTEGLVSTYGFRVSTSPSDLGPATGMGSVGAGFSEAAVSLELYGLQPHTTYYYRIVGENVDNVGAPTEGEIHSFTTTSYPPDEITVSQLRVLTEPFTAWPAAGAFVDTSHPPKASPQKCSKGKVRKGGKCVKKHKKHKRKKKGKKK